MNLLLLAPDDLVAPDRACIHDSRRLKHLHEVHRAACGETLIVGMTNAGIGRARLLTLEKDQAVFEILHLDDAPPPALPVHVLLALPRPRMLARSLENIATMGVKRLTLLHTARVEKSYWQSPELQPERIEAHLRLGLEQARDTVLPTVDLQPRFKPFVEDQLPAALAGQRALLAHPGIGESCPRGLPMDQPVTLAIGPEGGFIPFEVEMLQAMGFEGIHLGERILRVETAVVSLLSRLF
ncbi:ribosomal RNA small subunit methyltransferase E [Kushneria pakistanensis]|uniref:Ribosomal RNA small subunit methyltransferase E n=1 Tax=Kushneria pakistanensis TaxID=1508770 RepID=A0ABQ3FBI4_9GAMM|nr:16S rRNA (uracil(1498)-N(3))-methyltransferase [Kushneria pakistanensis]GHC16355.1 ribosomal RNA small subunit methyltransferase E [Kushneria pakistanensis]